jgi:hypothetical protein
MSKLLLCAGLCALVCAPQALGVGIFSSSDGLLNRVWQVSVETANDDVTQPVNLDARDCNINLALVILDGPVRDRCPYIGDLAVTGMTLLVSGGDVATLRAMIAWFASVQNADGSIPATPAFNHSLELIDYNAYWVETLYDYTLFTGDLTLLRSVFPNLVQLIDGLYPRHVDNSGLLLNWLGVADYAGIHRDGTTVAYYNAQYIRALGLAGALASWKGDNARAAAWRARARSLVQPFNAAFWDAKAGAYTDTAGNTTVHPLDGNVFAILAGVATPAQQQSVLSYVNRNMSSRYGDTMADSDALQADTWGPRATELVYPFISYYDVLARYAAGSDGSALALIRKEWGAMVSVGARMWETIDVANGAPLGPEPSWSHGWSSGAGPALMTQVLGVQPTSPGFATFTVTPHIGDLQWVEGDFPTPHGTIHVRVQSVNGKPLLTVTAPKGTTWANRPQIVKKPKLRPKVASARGR